MHTRSPPHCHDFEERMRSAILDQASEAKVSTDQQGGDASGCENKSNCIEVSEKMSLLS